MADTGDNLGDLTVNVTGDFSELQDAIDQSVTVAQSGSEAIASALQGVSDASGLAGRDLEIFQQIVQQDTDAGIALSQSLEDLSNSASQVGDTIAGGAAAALEQLQAAEEGAGQAADGTAIAWDDLATAGQYVTDTATAAVPALEDIATSESEVAQESAQAESGLQGIAEALAGLYVFNEIKEAIEGFAESALEAYGETQNLATALELLGSSAEDAESTIDSLSDMALTLAVPFASLESATQRLTLALQGVKGVDIYDVLTAAADASARTEKSFDTVSAALLRIITTGQVTARQLQSLGVTWQQLADTAGQSIAQTQALLKKGGQDAIQDLNLVTQTIEQTSAGAAQAMAQNVTGQIQTLSNQVSLMLDKIGQDIAPVAVAVIQAISSIVQEVRTLATEFQTLPPVIQNTIVTVAGLTVGAVALGAAASVLGYGLRGVIELAEGLAAVFGLGATAAGAEAGAETAVGVAAAAAAPEVMALAEAEGESAIAAQANAEGLAIQMGLFGEQTAVATAAGEQMELFAGATATSTTATGLFGAGLLGTVGTVAAVAAGLVVLYSNIKDIPTVASSTATSFSELKNWLGLSSDSLAVFAGGVVPVEEGIEGVKSATDDANSSIKGNKSATDDANSSGITWSGTLSTVWEGLKATLGPLGALNATLTSSGPLIDQVTGDLRDMDTVVNITSFAVQALGDKQAAMWAKTASAATVTTQQVVQGVQQQIIALGTLQGNLTKAQADLAAMNNSYQTGVILPGTQMVATLQNVQFAEQAVTKAQNALNTSLGLTANAMGDTTKATQPAADSIQALGDAITKANDTFDNANTTYANMLSAYQRGDTTLNGVALDANTITTAYNNLANAYLKATGQVLQWTATAPQVQQAAQTEINASTSLQNTLNQQLAAWQNLSNAGPQFAIAGSLAFEKVQSAAKALGIQVTETANGLQSTLADGSKIAADAVQPLIDKLNTLYGVQVETVTVNGQAVRTFQSLAQTLRDGETAVGQFGQTANLSANGVLVLKGASDSAGQSFDATQTKIINFNGTLASLTGTVVDNSHTITDATNGVVQYTQSMQDAADGVDNFTVIENDLTQSATDATGATNQEADALLALASAADDAADAVDNLNSATSKSGKGGAGGGTSLSGLLEGAIAASQGGGTSETVGSDLNQSQVDTMAQELADASGQVVTTLDGMFIPATQAAATQLAALQAQANATGKSFTVDLNGAITTITASTTANTTATTANTTATTANTTATAASTTATAASTTATAASTTATITQTQAQTNLAAAVTQYQTDLASGSATAQQLTLDLANVGSAEQGLTTTATQTMQALTQATTATDAATNSLAILSPTVDVAGFTLSDAVQATVQPLADAASSAETLSQAEAGAAQTVDEGTNALGVMTTGIQSSTNGLWTFVQSLNGVVQSMSDATANLGDLSNVAATVVAPLTSVQQAMQQLNADLAAYNAGGGSLATVRADQAALQTAQLAAGLTIENLGNLAMAAQTVVAPLTSVQQAMNQLNSDLASFGTNLRANLTPTQTSTIESDQAALQTAQLATLPTTSMVPGSASWQYVNPNPDLMSAPTGNGPDMNIPSESTSTGVNLVVNVTGNSVTSAALVDQLANKVSSVIVTNLRTNAGLKL